MSITTILKDSLIFETANMYVIIKLCVFKFKNNNANRHKDIYFSIQNGRSASGSIDLFYFT